MPPTKFNALTLFCELHTKSITTEFTEDTEIKHSFYLSSVLSVPSVVKNLSDNHHHKTHRN